MRIAITGATGFVGGAIAERLTASGHEVVRIGRRAGIDVTDVAALTRAFAGCDAVAHCAGINREIGDQTYERVHVQGTRAVVAAAQAAGVTRLVSVSFLRARPDGPSAYHRSKWAAEEIVRSSGLDWTVLKPGIIYGRGDHMLGHLSHVFHTLPVFGLVGVRDRDARRVRRASGRSSRRSAGSYERSPFSTRNAYGAWSQSGGSPPVWAGRARVIAARWSVPSSPLVRARASSRYSRRSMSCGSNIVDLGDLGATPSGSSTSRVTSSPAGGTNRTYGSMPPVGSPSNAELKGSPISTSVRSPGLPGALSR